MNLGRKKLISIIGVTVLTASLLVGCGAKQEVKKENLAGQIKIDGSSTVLPISEAAAEEFSKENKDVKITVGESGTGGGFKKFLNKEIDIADASRGIKKEEIDLAKTAGIEYEEIKVGVDGLTVVINKENTWAVDMTADELKKIWELDSKVKTWKDVRPEWPAENIKFFAPGTASGTFEFFTEAINKKAKAQRTDAQLSEDDNVLVQGVAGDKNAIGYFGYSYYEANKSKMTAVKVNSVLPSFDTIKDGSYKPLSRPLFIYVNKASLAKPEIKAFVKYYLENATTLVKEANYVPLLETEYKAYLEKIK